MKISNQFITCLIFFSLLSNLHSQTSIKAKNLLDEISLILKNHKNYQFDFKYILENNQENIRQETSGSIIVSGNKYKLLTNDITQFSDGNNLYTIIPENLEVIITKPDDEDNTILNPTELIEVYKSGYDFLWDIVQNISGQKIQYIKLIPTEDNDDISYILLGINMKLKQIYKLIEVGKQRTTTTLTIEKFNINNNLPSNLFTFNKDEYSEYYIN